MTNPRNTTSITKRIPAAMGNIAVGFALFAVIGVIVGSLWAATRATEYKATTLYYLRPPETTDATQALTADMYSFNRAKLYVSLFTSTELADRAAKRIRSDKSPSDLAASVSASDVYQTSLISVTVTAPTSDEALLIARGYASEVPSYAAHVEKDSGLRNAAGLIAAVDGPRTSEAGTGGWMIPAIAGAAFGLVGALLSLWYRRRFLVDDLVSISASLGISPYVELDSRDPDTVDRLTARVMSDPEIKHVLTLASPTQGDGAKALAEAMAESGDRLDIAVRVVNSEGHPQSSDDLKLTWRAVLEETPTRHVHTSGPLLVVARRYVTTKSGLQNTVRLLSASGLDPAGVVVLKGRSLRSRFRRSTSGGSGERAESSTPAVPVGG